MSIFQRQTTGSVVCRSCGHLVGVRDEQCYNCGARWPSLWGWSPVLRRFGADLGFVPLVIGACVALYVAALLLDLQGIRNSGFLSFLAPSAAAQTSLGASGILPVWEGGRWWTLLSAGWLHGGIIHIFFNMYWVRILAPPVAEMYGPARTVILYTVASVAGFFFSSVLPVALTTLVPGLLPVVRFVGAAGFTVGASAALMGLLAALIHYGNRSGQSAITRWAWPYAALFLVFGFLVGGVDNWAHIGGFLGGFLAARLLDPMKPERLNHLALAALCLGATVVAIVLSLIAGPLTVR